MSKSAATVYLVTNLANGKTYVGVTRFSLEKRWSEHRWHALNKPVSWLHKAIRKYGEERFALEAIASCLTPEAAAEAECEVIQRLRPAYNQVNGGQITFGRKLTAETKARIAASNRGQKRSPEAVAKNRAQAKARWATNTEYREMALAALAKGRANTDWSKVRAAAGRAARNRVWSAESRAKLSASCKKKYESPVERLKTSLSQIGKRVSDETRRNQSTAAKRRAQTEEGKANSRRAGSIGSAVRWGKTQAQGLVNY